MALTPTGLTKRDNMDPAMAQEHEQLERRIREESGPVKTIQTIEWLDPERGGRTQGAWANLQERGLSFSMEIMRQVTAKTRNCRIGWDNTHGNLVVHMDEKGPWTVSGGVTSRTPKVGGKNLAARLRAKGIPNGRHPARVEDGKRIVVEVGT